MKTREQHWRRRIALPLLAGSLVLAAAACGDDDEDADSTTAAAVTTEAASETTAADADTTEAGSDTTAAEGDIDSFCSAEVAAQAATSGDDPSAIQPAFEDLVAAAPEDIRPTVEDVIANAESGPGDPAFDAAYGEMLDFVRANCGFEEVAVGAINYAYTELPSTLASGPTIIDLTNNSTDEVHEIGVARINDGVTETLDELLALPEDEVDTKVTFKGFAFAFPGVTAHAVIDLEPGRYVGLCFLPQGATPEVISQMDGPDSTAPPGAVLGPPHFVLGMKQEFTVG
jgi:hypothetical protein